MRHYARQKKSLGKLWLITKRKSPHGTFYVANAVFVLVVGVASYLVCWSLTALVISAYSFVGRSSLEFWWINPSPWWSLCICAYVSIHGFVVGCSPRSPLSIAHASQSTNRVKWYYLPVPKSPLVCNLTLILPCVVFTVVTFTFSALAGRAFYSAKNFAHEVLPLEMWEKFHILAHDYDASFGDDAMEVSDELVYTARTVAAAYFDSHRICLITMWCYVAGSLMIWIPCIIYGIPNSISLVDHACSRYADPLPPSCTTFIRKLHFLLTQGKPKTEYSSTHLNLTTWKMTILAVVYVQILIICVPAYAFICLFNYFDSWPKRVLAGDTRQTMIHAMLAASVITVCSCTFVAAFCTVATLDPLFRAAIGLNMIRTQIPIDIQVVHHSSRHEELDPTSTTSFALKERGFLSLNDLDHGRSFDIKPEASTFSSIMEHNPSTAEEVDVQHFKFDTDDIEACHPTAQGSAAGTVSVKRSSM